jgi:RNA polymerase sigma-70 factor, ECF subfamily
VPWEGQITSSHHIGAVADPHSGGPSIDSDSNLMARVQRGDTGAFAELYARHAVRAMRVAHAICRDAAAAEDAVQEGFMAIWRSRARYRADAGSFQAWAMRMVQNRAIDALRDSSARLRREQLEAIGAARFAQLAPSTHEEAISRWERRALRASLSRLPASQAQVIVLAYFGGLTQAEIAVQLELPEGTVKGRMRLGLQKLRREMIRAGLVAENGRGPRRQTAARSRGRFWVDPAEKRMASSSIGP